MTSRNPIYVFSETPLYIRYILYIFFISYTCCIKMGYIYEIHLKPTSTCTKTLCFISKMKLATMHRKNQDAEHSTLHF